jgi:hypothetical protein
MGKGQKEKKGELGISKGLGKRINKALGKVDGNCELTEISDKILTECRRREMDLVCKLINGGLEELFTTVQGMSFDIGFVMGYATAQMSDIPDRKFKATIEDVKKLIIDRGVLPEMKTF